MLLTVGVASAQFPQFLNSPSKESNVAGRFVARNYVYPGIRIALGNAPAGAASFTMSSGGVRLQDGRSITPFSSGGLSILGAPSPGLPAIPITIGAGTTKETVTPTAVSGCIPSIQNGGPGAPVTCQISATFANAHGQGEVVTSGTFGIQEAINDAAFFNASSGAIGRVVIDTGLVQAVGLANVNAGLALVNALPGVMLDDETGLTGAGSFAARATSTSTAAAAAAPTLTAVACPAGSTGLTAGAYLAKLATVDVTGMVSQASSESASATTSTALPCLTFTAPAAAAGQIGFLPYITAAAGASGTETLLAVTAANVSCTVTLTEALIPACIMTNTTYGQVGATVTLLANAPATAPKPLGTETVNRTAFAYQPVGGLVAAPMPNVVLSQPATGTAAGTYQLIGMALPSGYLNAVGHKFRLCLSGHDTFGGVAGQTLALTIAYGPYNNSDVALVAYGATAAGTGVAGTQTFQGCTELNTTVAGASGTIQAHGIMNVNLGNTNVDSPIVDQQAAATALPLSTQQWLRVQLVTVGTLGAGFVVDSFSIESVS
jgi:hypothetical protein